MTQRDRHKEALSNWQRAVESLSAAGLLLTNGHFDFAASRAYYAAFYAASALLLAEGREFSKHSGVIAAIHKGFVRTGRLDTEPGRALAWLFELRGIADYGESQHVPESEAARALEASSAFVEACRKLLIERGLSLPA